MLEDPAGIASKLRKFSTSPIWAGPVKQNSTRARPGPHPAPPG